MLAMIEQKVYTISQLNAQVRMLLEDTFPLILVEGEISNLVQAQSGHTYFTLKDKFAQIRCAMFKTRNNSLSFFPTNGRHVLVQAQVGIYEQRGDFQLIVCRMEDVSEGILRRKFDELKSKLQQEGLFALEHKRAIPYLPKSIGVITSPVGAAIHDIITILQRRFPSLPIIIYPTQVQGAEAAGQIVKAVQIANQRQECDVIILARGGGSLEDLWPFNEEIVARAVYHSNIPVVTGVGHESDVTIADLVADLRAATPSAAAELVSPDQQEVLAKLEHLEGRLTRVFYHRLHTASLLLENQIKRLRHPYQRIQTHAQYLDNLEQRLHFIWQQIWQQKKAEFDSLIRSLQAVSPLATLARGYAIITKEQKIIYSSLEVKISDNIKVQLKDGYLKCKVEDIYE